MDIVDPYLTLKGLQLFILNMKRKNMSLTNSKESNWISYRSELWRII